MEKKITFTKWSVSFDTMKNRKTTPHKFTVDAGTAREAEEVALNALRLALGVKRISAFNFNVEQVATVNVLVTLHEDGTVSVEIVD